MSKLNDLIKSLCSNDIKYICVKDIVDVVNDYKSIKKNSISKFGQFPVIDQGKKFISGYSNDESLVIKKGEFIIFGDHTREIKYINFPFIPGDSGVKVLTVNKDFVLCKYVYHCLKNLEITNRGYNRHWTVLAPMTIPVPPVEVQNEIVKILDKFSELEASLEAELKARISQYDFWREKLCGGELSYLIQEEKARRIKLNKICEVGTLTRGKRFVKADAVEDGVACIHYGELYTYYGISAYKTKSYINEKLANKLRFAEKGDVVIVGAGENNVDIGVGVAWLGEEKPAIHDACYIFKHPFNPKYISYYLRTKLYHNQLKRWVSEGKICAVSAKGIGECIIPIPSVARQNEIVSILDMFDKLINDITVGIPAEIELRRKQYEYYRNKLLNFEEI